MQENVGRIDRIARGLVGKTLAVLGAVQLRRHNPGLGAIGIAAGAILLHSAITRVSVTYALLGLDSRSEVERLRDSRNALQAATALVAERYGDPDVVAVRLA